MYYENSFPDHHQKPKTSQKIMLAVAVFLFGVSVITFFIIIICAFAQPADAEGFSETARILRFGQLIVFSVIHFAVAVTSAVLSAIVMKSSSGWVKTISSAILIAEAVSLVPVFALVGFISTILFSTLVF